MEPQTPQVPQQPEGAPLMQPNNKKKLSKTQWIIIIICIVVIVLIVAIKLLMALFQGGSNNSTTHLDSNIYYAREGYSLEQTGATIGDPLALDMSKHSAPMTSSQGNPIVYACNILSINDLQKTKVYLGAREDPKAVTRGFLDRTGKAGVEVNQYTLPGASSSDDNNTCQYGLQSGGLLDMAVYQPPYTLMEAVQDTLDRRYDKVDSIGGLTAYKEKDSDSTTDYMLVSGQSAIEILFNGTKIDSDTQKKLVTIAAQNFTAQEKIPVGPSIPEFKSPTYTKKYARACDFISNDDIKSLTGADASVYSTESLPSGTGVAKVDNKLYNSIATTCERYNTGLGSGLTAGPFDQKLEVTMTSFNADAPAKKYMEVNRKEDKEQVAATIGDEGYGYRDTAGQNTLRFRQGRFIVEVIFDRTVQGNAGLEETAAMTQKLTPYAQQVAAKLKPMQ